MKILQPNNPSRKLALHFIFGLIVSIALMAIFFVTLEVDSLVDILKEVNYWMIIPSICSYLISVFFRSLRWKYLLIHLKDIKIRILYVVVVIGYMANSLLPMRIGELVRSYYLSNESNISKSSALATILVERVLDAVTLLLFIGVGAVFVPMSGISSIVPFGINISSTVLVILFIAIFFGSLLTLIAIAKNPLPMRKFVIKVTILLSLPFKDKISSFIEMFFNGFTSLKDLKNVLFLLALSVPIWGFEAGVFSFMAHAFHLDSMFGNWWQFILVMFLTTSISNVGSSIPAAPGGIGLFELVARETLVWLPFGNITREIAGGYVALVHAVLIIPLIILGQIFLWTMNFKSIKDVFQD
ncbi:uncharacterized protein METZ01_LOCUS198003 [marine metagenome]|uniref:Flippase-like domain-containing protein n=1 Tax=marine metagenome TaxID=408172 RepID=A0A382E412_9ZZZZ